MSSIEDLRPVCPRRAVDRGLQANASVGGASSLGHSVGRAYPIGMKIGCLITNYESWEFTLHSLERLLKYQDYLHRCVVLDDCSESAVPDDLLLQHPIVDFRRNTQNLGFVRSVNI